jgi:hypothetical protein
MSTSGKHRENLTSAAAVLFPHPTNEKLALLIFLKIISAFFESKNHIRFNNIAKKSTLF